MEALGAPQRIFVASRKPGHPFSAAQTVGSTPWQGNAGADEVVAAIDTSGRIILAWKQADNTGRDTIMAAAGRSGSRVGTARPISAPSPVLGAPNLVIGPGDRAVAAWSTALHSDRETLQVATSRVGANFSRPHALFTSSCVRGALWPSSNGVLVISTCEVRGRTHASIAQVAWP